MSAAAAAAAVPSSADDRVYRAVVAHESVDQVRRVIESSQSAAAAVNQAGANGETPLRAARRLRRYKLLCLLIENGAEGAGDGDRFEAVRWCVEENDLAGLRRLIERGVSVNTASEHGGTHLMAACYDSRRTADRRDLTLEVFRLSSAETRRAVNHRGFSAVDCFFIGRAVLLLQPWQVEMIGGLLAAGAPVRSDNAARAVPLAAARIARREAELAACRSMGHGWRAQETFVGVSLDMSELRVARQMVAVRRARLEALEREVGSETDSDDSRSESGSESGSGSDSESEEDEATG